MPTDQPRPTEHAEQHTHATAGHVECKACWTEDTERQTTPQHAPSGEQSLNQIMRSMPKDEAEANLRRLGYYAWQALEELSSNDQAESGPWCSVTGQLIGGSEQIVVVVSHSQVSDWPGWARQSEVDGLRADLAQRDQINEEALRQLDLLQRQFDLVIQQRDQYLERLQQLEGHAHD